jgi:hypothetical protein
MEKFENTVRNISQRVWNGDNSVFTELPHREQQNRPPNEDRIRGMA